MPVILVDGYNAIGVAHRDLEAQRAAFMEMLSSFGKTRGHDITVVFDGWKSGGQKEQRSTIGGVMVVFSRLGEKADSVIKRILEEDRRHMIVVSSDGEVASHAWSKGSVPVPSEIFMEFLEGKRRAFDGRKDEDGEDMRERRIKGRRRTPSKKEKALRRALGRL